MACVTQALQGRVPTSTVIELSEFHQEYTWLQVFIIDDGTPLNAETHYRGIYVAMEKPRQV